MKYYIASPGFNDAQLNKIKSVQSELDRLGAEYYSPFKGGDNLKLGDNEDLNKLQIKYIFDKNINEMLDCNKMIAIVDDFDKGTAFEIGFFAAYRGKWELNHNLLMLGALGEEISVIIENLCEKKFHRLEVIDITTKSLEAYVTMGYLYAMKVKIVTYTSIPLESNVMTACATYMHFNKNKGIETFKKFSKKMKKAIKSGDLYTNGALFRLSPVKFFSKVE